MNVTFRVNADVKRDADALFSELGMSMSTAFNIFLRQSIREQRIPFVVGQYMPNPITLAAMDAAAHDEDIYGPFDSLDELMEALDA